MNGLKGEERRRKASEEDVKTKGAQPHDDKLLLKCSRAPNLMPKVLPSSEKREK